MSANAKSTGRYRIEYRHPVCGWVPRGNHLFALTKRAAVQALTAENEHEEYYARLGAPRARLRIVSEQTGEVL